ncbi:MAG: hypothetical protein GYB65_03845 [Chloroflexi bacterium]|nr:hypothetical protein [Chloroflexota bacterium]
MPYLIDGHNLIGKMRQISLDDPHDEAKLVHHLRRYMARHRKRCTVVFDGGLPGGPSRDLSTHSVRVIFAHGGTTADNIILERIRATHDISRLIVVSADREIVDVARRKHFRVVSPAQFAAELETQPVPTEDDANPHISADEVEEWMRLFGVDSGEEE